MEEKLSLRPWQRCQWYLIFPYAQWSCVLSIRLRPRSLPRLNFDAFLLSRGAPCG